MTKSEWEALRLLWKTEDLSDPSWQAVLSEEEAALVRLWDDIRIQADREGVPAT